MIPEVENEKVVAVLWTLTLMPSNETNDKRYKGTTNIECDYSCLHPNIAN
jgi:hypothetical protein